jgi:hypothetical protein
MIKAIGSRSRAISANAPIPLFLMVFAPLQRKTLPRIRNRCWQKEIKSFGLEKSVRTIDSN